MVLQIRPASLPCNQPYSSILTFLLAVLGRKVRYLAPIKALCTEKVEEWSKKFRPLGLVVGEVTGDNENDSRTLAGLDVICSTPEKW